ncbi:alpha/beta hydrolase [Actinoplanes teichomyceticus]|uniref:TAP-like protein n=1 Tax=Actinoplanes teichomyceticus TaxID=1867 RepID=A0A561WMM5_ACTTI|nr:alpha/beta hydrolase [Actinoplanes teichomyceticus]TWG25120.1 TAP-like protein [Actinoplanes teichomyceticus]GIF10191.1 peptidase [Actinoplanes teichomyceticus]
MHLSRSRLVVAGIAGIALVAGSSVAAEAASPARTSKIESKRVDSVPTPKLGWYKCYEIAECATVKLPLDYDKPKGAKTEIAVLRVKAKDQKHKIGSLFLNPGGPGGSGTDIALNAPYFLSESLLQKFDIVGVDPRGIGASANIKCFTSVKAQSAVMAKLNIAFPVGAKQEATYTAGAKAFGKACSTTGKPLSGAMSTAEVARDMDVIRRAVGDKKLTYLGFSYGTVLGEYYANMFPDRVRALAIDGNLDPRAWVGAGSAGDRILDARLHSADGAYRALKEIFKRCDRAGEKYCAFAAGNPEANFAAITRSLKAKPVVVTDEEGTFTITYADFVSAELSALYSPYAGENTMQLAADIAALIKGGSSPAVAAARTSVLDRIRTARATGYDFPYDNSFETTMGVVCTDGTHPKNAASWPAATAVRDRQAPYFGRAWGYIDAPCARSTWTVRDEDAYRGPFNKRTSAPVLLIGNYWDPATNYDASVAMSRVLPNSRLLTSDNWGHTAYGTGACATAAIDNYLLKVALPAKGTTCAAEHQPFTEPIETGGEPATATTMSATPGKRLPPVAAPRPVSILTGGR